jgi:predicted NBD/HSP70 family sugar kinase
VPTSALAGMLELVHYQPGISRAAAAQALNMTSGFAAETTARLVQADLLEEGPAPATGRRGRPTTSLLPHPEGPLVAVAAITHETWMVAAVQLGGTVVASTERSHRRAPSVRAAVASRLGDLHARFGGRIGCIAVSVPGTVTGTTLVQAPGLGWHDVDLAALRPAGAAHLPLVAGNDATFAGIAEYRRGAAAGSGTCVHLYMDDGIGGVYLDGGRPITGATGTAGEYGHMPFGSNARVCRCGARGCWNTTLEGDAIGRLLDQEPPEDKVTYTREVLSAARGGSRRERRAVAAVARSLGRGAAGLVNALDPGIVTLGGLARAVLECAGPEAEATYRAGLMRVRLDAPPPLVPGRFGDGGPIVGAADEGFAVMLRDDSIRRWMTGCTAAGVLSG